MQCRPTSQAVQRTRRRRNDGLRPKVPHGGCWRRPETKGGGACQRKPRGVCGYSIYDCRRLVRYCHVQHRFLTPSSTRGQTPRRALLMIPGAQPAVVLDATWQVPYLRSI